MRTGGRPSITVSYTLAAPRGSNLSNGVTDSSLVIVGPATYVTLVEQAHRPADVRLELPATWKPAATSLDAAPDGQPNHFIAPDYDILADSPILAGVHMSSADFTVGGAKHSWVYLGDAEWDGQGGGRGDDPADRRAPSLLGKSSVQEIRVSQYPHGRAAAPASSI